MTPEALVAFAEGLSRIAAAGGGPKAFAAYLAQALDGGVLVEDAESKHLAAAGATDGIPASIGDAVEKHDATPHATLRMRNGRPGIAATIYAGDSHLGWLAAFGANLADRELLVRLTASAIGLELAREQGGGRSRRRAFWEALIGGAYHDAATARDDAASRGIVLANSYVAVALEFESSPDERENEAAFPALRRVAGDTFRSADADVAILENGAAVTLLVPAAREVDVSNIRTAATLFPRTLAKKMPSSRIGGGVGERADLLELGRSVRQAASAMTIGRRMFGSGKIALYDDLGIYPLLFEGADVATLRAFAARVLAPLRAYDDKHQTELVRTLALYFSLGENVKTAAAELNVHRHTVFYRLRQIADICSAKLDSPHDQLTLRLAIAIDALIK